MGSEGLELDDTLTLTTEVFWLLLMPGLGPVDSSDSDVFLAGGCKAGVLGRSCSFASGEKRRGRYGGEPRIYIDDSEARDVVLLLLKEPRVVSHRGCAEGQWVLGV